MDSRQLRVDGATASAEQAATCDWARVGALHARWSKPGWPSKAQDAHTFGAFSKGQALHDAHTFGEFGQVRRLGTWAAEAPRRVEYSAAVASPVDTPVIADIQLGFAAVGISMLGLSIQPVSVEA